MAAIGITIVKNGKMSYMSYGEREAGWELSEAV